MTFSFQLATPNKHVGMANRFDCSICTESKTIKQLVQCASCAFQVCKICQKRYLLPSCMNCRAEFTRAFLIETLGVTFVNGTQTKHAKELLLSREKELLQSTQPHVDWERTRRKEMDKARFGVKPVIPPAPTVSKSRQGATVEVFPCPSNGCRGFATRGSCGVCHVPVCMMCRELTKAGHVCNPESLKSVEKIREDSRPCPRCNVFIFRSYGCNHMFCTHCQTHFDWETNRILSSSTNHHYVNVARFSENVAVRPDAPNASEDDEDCDGPFAIFHDRVKLESLPNISPELKLTLFDDVKVIRFTKQKMFDEQKLVTDLQTGLLKIRVQYMMGELTENVWINRVYTMEKQTDRDLHYSQLLTLYLQFVNTCQRKLARSCSDMEQTLNELSKFIDMCNESFATLHNEYGGTLMQLRTDFTKPELPPLSL